MCSECGVQRTMIVATTIAIATKQPLLLNIVQLEIARVAGTYVVLFAVVALQLCSLQPPERSPDWHLDPKRRKRPMDGRWAEWRKDNLGAAAARRSQDVDESRQKHKEYKLI